MQPNECNGDAAPQEARLASEHELVLVLETGGDGFCSCLEGLCDPATDNVLRVSYDGARNHVADDWAEAFGDEPAQAFEVLVGPGGPKLSESQDRHVAGVTPGDLTGLGVTLSEMLNGEMAGNGESVLCFDSLTVALQYTDRRTMFQFLHTLTGHLRRTKTRAHFHLDRDTVEEQAVATVSTLFDALVTVDADGDTSVRSR